jgi:hypothetical protein
MTKYFGNIFTYSDLKTLPDGNIVYYTCILPTGSIYTSIELDIETGNLIYYHKNAYFGTFSIHQGTRS